MRDCYRGRRCCAITGWGMRAALCNSPGTKRKRCMLPPAADTDPRQWRDFDQARSLRKPVPMTTKHQDSLRQYVNDMIGLETDVSKAIRGQLDDERVNHQGKLVGILGTIVGASESRLERLKKISDEEGGSFGETIKEGVTAATGALAGVYGRLREHPVSRMVRDDIVAQSTASTAYGMLLTLALVAGHAEVAAIAEEGLSATSPAVISLTDVLPDIVVSELAEDEPVVNTEAAAAALKSIRASWK
jgi:hypothetical protein